MAVLESVMAVLLLVAAEVKEAVEAGGKKRSCEVSAAVRTCTSGFADTCDRGNSSNSSNTPIAKSYSPK